VLKGRGLGAEIEAALDARGGETLCLLVDQFEEIFRWARERSEAEARLFIEFLLNSSAPRGVGLGRLLIVVTMRSEYLGQCAAYERFAELLNARQYLIPRLDEFGLLRAVQEPARLYGGDVASPAATQLLSAAAGEVDALPVLQHALMRTHIELKRGAELQGKPLAPGWVIGLEDIARIGGVGGALHRHAEEVLATATGGRYSAEIGEMTGGDSRLVDAAEWMFRSLTDLDADLRPVRRPCTFQELVSVSGVTSVEAAAILDAFRAPDCNFIGPYISHKVDDDQATGAAPRPALNLETVVDISHEALIRQWRRVSSEAPDPATKQKRGLMFREFVDGLIWRTLATQAEGYAADKKAVLSPAATRSRLEWFRHVATRPKWIARYVTTGRFTPPAAVDDQWRAVAAFMSASEANMRAEESLVGRLKLTRNVGAVVFVALAIAGAVAFGLALDAKHHAERDKLRAEQAQAAALKEQALYNSKFAVASGFVGQLIDLNCDHKQLPPGAQGSLKDYQDSCTAILQQDFQEYLDPPTVNSPASAPLASPGCQGSQCAVAIQGQAVVLPSDLQTQQTKGTKP